ncbi:hypothetical protein SKAU_G00276790 [Synaphobranchus kaupii]|uniref:Uncharacterized protein n=1 Tax=Synaphobranchus kaupii TaxID=118154 RepID=A0A9Q1F1E3_SYNKA|nr:hypothetical protein SKAU_G00276790 [Synaphobranchus kaupii]
MPRVTRLPWVHCAKHINQSKRCYQVSKHFCCLIHLPSPRFIAPISPNPVQGAPPCNTRHRSQASEQQQQIQNQVPEPEQSLVGLTRKEGLSAPTTRRLNNQIPETAIELFQKDLYSR